MCVTLQFYLQEEILVAKVNKYIISEYGNKSEVQGATSETIMKDLIYIGLTENGTFKGKAVCLKQVKNGRKRQKGLNIQKP